jgi:hypothetical protein
MTRGLVEGRVRTRGLSTMHRGPIICPKRHDLGDLEAGPDSILWGGTWGEWLREISGEDLVNLDSTGVTLAGCGPTPAGDCVGSRPRKPRIDSEWALGSPCN